MPNTTVSNERLVRREVMDLFPKVDLHRHIEGSFDIPTLFEISKKNSIDAPRDFTEFQGSVQFPKNHPPDFKVFLSKFRSDWYRDFGDVENLIYKSVLGFKSENLHYLELRFSPEHFANFNNFDRIDVCKAVIANGNRAAKECGFAIKYLITFNRFLQKEDKMIELYKKIAAAGLSDIIGYDLAGDELENPAEQFEKLFGIIHSDKFAGITIHAGEVTTPEQIAIAIDKLHAQRIGHGVVAIRDEKLQKRLIEENICLEQCPVSNYFTGAWVDTPLHPFKRLNELGVPVTINSDDPTIQGTNLTDDFIAAVKFYGQDMRGLRDLNARAISAAFLKPAARQKLIAEYDEKVLAFVQKAAEI